MLFYFVLFRTAAHLGEDSAVVDALSAFIRATFLTMGFVVAWRFVGWLRDHPEQHRRGAMVAVVVMVILLGAQVIHYLGVPSQISSPLIPEHMIAYVRRPILVEGLGLSAALVLGLAYRRSGRMVNCVVCGIAALAFAYLFPPMWSLYIQFIQAA
jgi:biotin transporter BioY